MSHLRKCRCAISRGLKRSRLSRYRSRRVERASGHAGALAFSMLGTGTSVSVTGGGMGIIAVLLWVADCWVVEDVSAVLVPTLIPSGPMDHTLFTLFATQFEARRQLRETDS
jgi:hypothetical protein